MLYREYIVFNVIHDISNRFVSKSINISDDNYHNLITSNVEQHNNRPLRVYSCFGMRIRLVKSINEAAVVVDSIKHKYQIDLYNFGSLFNNDDDNDDSIESIRSDGSNKKKHSIGFYLLHYINSKVFMQTLAVRIQSTFDNINHVEL